MHEQELLLRRKGLEIVFGPEGFWTIRNPQNRKVVRYWPNTGYWLRLRDSYAGIGIDGLLVYMGKANS